MEEKNIMEQVLEATENKLKELIDEGLTQNNIDYIGKVVDVHKDIKNEEHWKKKEEEYMRYRTSYNESGNYGNFDNYRDGGSYGRRGRYSARGYDTKYRGEEMLDRMADSYGRYMEGNESYGRGVYGAKEDTMKSLEFMLQSAYDFMCMLKEEAKSQEEVELVQHYARKISEM